MQIMKCMLRMWSRTLNMHVDDKACPCLYYYSFLLCIFELSVKNLNKSKNLSGLSAYMALLFLHTIVYVHRPKTCPAAAF